MKRVDIDPKSKLLIVKFKFLKRDWEEAVQTRKNMLTLSRKTYMPALKKYLVPPTPENIEALWEWGFSFPDNWKELVGAEDQIQETPEVLPYLDIQVPDYLDFLRPYQVTAVQFLKWRKGRGLISDDMGCISGDAIIQINRGGGSKKYSLRKLYKSFNRTSGRYTWDKSIKTFTRCYKDDIGVFGLHELEKVLYKGDQECIRIETESGKSIELTEDHELMTPDNNWQAAIDFSVGDYLLTNGDPCCKKCGSTENVITYKYSKFPGYCKKCMYAELRTHKNDIEGIRKRQGSDGYIYLVGKGVRNHHRRSTSGVLEHIYIMENYLGREIDLSVEEVHHKNGIRNDNSLGNLEVLTKREHSKKHKIYNHFDCDKVPVIPRKDKITKIVKVGKKDVYDIVMKDPYRNFIANKFIVHNCGKTIEALAWIRWNRNLGPAVIVCPTCTKLQWEREYKKFYGNKVEVLYGKTPYPLRKNTSYIINWEILTYWEKALLKKPFFCMIADECFPYYTSVTTDKGVLFIGDIVANKIDCKVLSYDLKEKVLTFKPILRYFEKVTANSNLVRIVHTNGSFTCTKNHKIWSYTDEKYKRADEIYPGEDLYFLQQTIFNKKSWKEYSKILFQKLRLFFQYEKTRSFGEIKKENSPHKRNRLSTLWDFFYCKGFSRYKDSEILFNKLFCKTSKSRRYVHGRKEPEYKRGSEKMGSFFRLPKIQKKNVGKNERKQSLKESGCYSKRISYKIEKRNTTSMDWCSWWEWNRVHQRTKSFIIFIRERMAWGICGAYRKQTPLPNTLQNRYSFPSNKDSCRGRWKKSQIKEGARKRPKENKILGIVRVESVSFLELGHSGKVARDNQTTTVFNIEVAENHNYFANNVLVSNCHYMGNIKSKRTISAMKIAKKYPSFVPMSGTPIETKTRQLFPILKLLDRHLFYSEWEFLNRYCLGKSKDGFPNYDGASHTKELHSKVKKLMIRRKKREVLKDLPPLQRTIVPMDLSKQQRKYKQMEDHFFNTYSPQQRGSIKMDQEFDSLRLQVFDMKYQAIIEWIDEFLLSGEKLVVGVWHQRVIQTLHQHYKDCSTMIYGKITGTKREKALQDFYTDKQIIFLQEKSGGVGLDGLQHVCCNMAIIEFPASPTLLDQFESRLERSGQENPMNMAYLIGAGTIEEDIMEALDIRRLNIDAVMDGKESEDVDLLTILFERRMNNE